MKEHLHNITLPELENILRKSMDAATVVNGKRVSFADKVTELLNEESRKHGLKGGKKHAKREANAKIGDRTYFAMHMGTWMTLPMPRCTSKTQN